MYSHREILQCIFFFIVTLFTVVSGKSLDDDMLLYWRRSGTTKCEPFTTYLIKCNKCVCSADGTTYCTRMACFKAPKFLTDPSVKITPVNVPDQSEYVGPSASAVH